MRHSRASILLVINPMKLLPPFLTPLLLCGCVGGTLGDTKDFEMFPLRAATGQEGRGLKRCLQTAHKAQEAYRRKHGKYARRTRELPIDADCSGFNVGQKGTPTGYEIRAELREDDTTVRWSVNEKGLIEEHLDPESETELEL